MKLSKTLATVALALMCGTAFAATTPAASSTAAASPAPAAKAAPAKAKVVHCKKGLTKVKGKCVKPAAATDKKPADKK